MKASVSATLLILLFCIQGCGYVDTPGHPGETLWTLKCRIGESQPGVDPGNLRVALAWARKLGPSNGVALINQDLPIQPQFPSSFTLDLFELPPEEALIEGENGLAGLKIAVGLLLVYDDLNMNRKLDILPADAQEYVDYLLGPAEQYQLVFTETPPQGQSIDGLAINAGMNLLHLNGETGPQKLTFDQTLTVTLIDSLLSQHRMCVLPPAYSVSEDDLGEVDHTEIPEGAEIECLGDGYTLEFNKIEWQQDGVCGDITEMHLSGSSRIPNDQTPPAGWPCQV